MNYTIAPASREDAGFIADVVLGAIGKEHTLHMAGSEERIPLVQDVFRHLAEKEDSQYSYRNTLIARSAEGTPIGAVITYDGALLHSLRQAFIEEANHTLGWNLRDEQFTDETSPDEIYLDSLMVLPEHRGEGIGTRLITAAKDKAREAGKPLGLLVDFENPHARSLYTSLGFRSAGIRPFAGKDMEHMVLNLLLNGDV